MDNNKEPLSVIPEIESSKVIMEPADDVSLSSYKKDFPRAKRDSPQSRKHDEKIGSSITPRYGERHPMTYHLFESELTQISSLNGQALAFFSIGAFFAALFANILVSYSFAAAPISDLAWYMSHWGLFISAGLSVLLFVFGGWFVFKRHTVVTLIKSETIESQPK